MPKYAKDQPTGFKNTIERVAIVGAGGTIGKHITTSLLATGQHKITALSRANSSNKLPSGVHIATVDYNDESTLISALRDQQFLIITLSPTAPKETHSNLVTAASKAGVPYIMPNGYGPDISDTKFGVDTLLGPVASAQREEIENLGMEWVTICCGFWYDYSLAGGEARFGFDLGKRELTLYDDGETKISTSTLASVGRAIARVLSLPMLPVDEDDGGLMLATFVNKPVYIQSFRLSQNEMFESVKRVTGTTDADWSITHEDSRKRYADGLAMVKKGNMAGFSKLLYARAFWKGESSDFEEKVHNGVLGLEGTEDLDEATRAGIELVKELQSRAERMAH
ncbi:hypothetical protein BDV06DRAFT_42136 [Aspergillus oleicola]